MKKANGKIFKYLWLLILFVLILFLFRSCRSFGYDFEFTYTSPQGTNSFVVKYDFVSRPSIFKRGFLRDKKIWTYPGPAFMETVSFEPEWLSETQIRFTYDDVDDEWDEEFIITIPY